MDNLEIEMEERCTRCGTDLSSGTCPRCLSLLFGSLETDTSSTEPQCLRRLGDYDLLEELARGGMGVVYRARQRSLNREVALKLMRDSALARLEDIKRFRAEAAAVARLKHANIISIHEVGEIDGQHYFVMDLVAGVSLAERTREGPLRAREAAELVLQIAEAVQHAHQEGVLHRDIKPSNVLVDAFGKAFLTDFGVARPLDVDSSLTVTGQVLGTPGYMPPEQAAGNGTVGPSADIYSMGALLYHLLTGRPPFVGASPGETLRQVLEQEPVSPAILNAQVPVDLTSVCLKCLAKRPKERYESAGALAQDLRRFLNGETTVARPASRTERLTRWIRRKPALSTAIMCGVLAAVIGLVGVLWQWRLAERARQAAEANALAASENVYAADMLNAQVALSQGALGRAIDLLFRYEPKWNQHDFRGWEWWFWSALCLEKVEAAQRVSNSVPSTSANSPVSAFSIPVFAQDNRTIAHGNKDGTVDLSDGTNGKILTTIPAGMNPVGFADGGRTLISAAVKTPLPLEPNEFGGLEFWDTTSRVMKHSWTPSSPREIIGAVSLSPDGKFVVTGDLKGNTTLRNALDGSVVKTFRAGGSRVWNLVFSPDSSVVAVAMEDEVKLWSIGTDRGVSIDGKYAPVAFSPDGRTVATGYYRQVRLYRTSTGEFLDGFLTEGNSWLAFSNDGKTLACANGAIELWNVPTRCRLAAFLPDSDAQFVSFSPNGRTLIGGKPGEMRVWTAANEEQLERLWSSSVPITSEASPPRDPSRIPPRDTGTPRQLIDLSRQYTAALTDTWMGSGRNMENSLGELKPGVQTLAGVPFDVRGIVQIGSLNAYPRKISRIPVGLRCRTLHFLHAAFWGVEKSGTRIGSYRIHFASGARIEIPIVLGQDVLDWAVGPGSIKNSTVTVAWSGSNQAARAGGDQRHLFKTTWRNPSFDQTIQNIDFIWAGNQAQPFLVAITAE